MKRCTALAWGLLLLGTTSAQEKKTAGAVPGDTFAAERAVRDKGLAWLTKNQAADGSNQVTESIGSVTTSAAETGEAASGMLDSASDLARQADMLRAERDRFLAGVRAAEPS